MSRSTYVFRHGLSAERSREVATKFLKENKFRAITLRTGEQVWKHGTGIILAAQCLSLYYEDYKTTCYAWIQTGAGLTSRSEMDLYGMGGFFPKKVIMKLMDRLEETLRLEDPDYHEGDITAWPDEAAEDEEDELIEDDELMDDDEEDEESDDEDDDYPDDDEDDL